MMNPKTDYIIDNFVLSNKNCPIVNLTIEKAPDGSVSNYTSTDGTSLVTMSSKTSDVHIIATLPPIQEDYRFFYFTIKAVA